MQGQDGDGGNTVRPHLQVSPRVQQAKKLRADSAAREARKAVDSFTASIEAAMRGQQL